MCVKIWSKPLYKKRWNRGIILKLLISLICQLKFFIVSCNFKVFYPSVNWNLFVYWNTLHVVTHICVKMAFYVSFWQFRKWDFCSRIFIVILILFTASNNVYLFLEIYKNWNVKFSYFFNIRLLLKYRF